MTINLNPQGKDDTIKSAMVLKNMVETEVLAELRANPYEPSNLKTGYRLVKELKALDQKLKNEHIKPILEGAIRLLISELELQAKEVRGNPHRLARYYKYEAEEAKSIGELNFIKKLVKEAIQNTPQMNVGVFNITLDAIKNRKVELRA